MWICKFKCRFIYSNIFNILPCFAILTKDVTVLAICSAHIAAWFLAIRATMLCCRADGTSLNLYLILYLYLNLFYSRFLQPCCSEQCWPSIEIVGVSAVIHVLAKTLLPIMENIWQVQLAQRSFPVLLCIGEIASNCVAFHHGFGFAGSSSATPKLSRKILHNVIGQHQALVFHISNINV